MAINNIISSTSKNLLQFKALPKLEFKVDLQKGYVKYGKDNLYPSELVRLYNEHPEHRAIINRKARYIAGKCIKAVKPEDEIKVNAFIDTFNRKEDLNKVLKKITSNTELFNGVYIEIITNLQGKPIEMYFLNSANCRVNEDCTKLYFCKNWTNKFNQTEIKEIEKFEPNSGKAGTFFVEFKYYTPSSSYLNSIYPVAQYQSIVDDINTDIDISTFNKNYVNNGFSVGKMITFFSGTPTPEMKSEIDRRFKGTYTGEDGENVLINFVDREDKEPVITDILISDLSEKFAFTSKRAQKKIFAGHEMASELFNIKFDDSFLTGAPDLLTLQELFVKGYVEPRQNDLLEFLSYLSYLKTGEYLEMMFEPISLIGADLSNDVDLTIAERRSLKGYETEEIAKGQAQAVNDAINSLSPLVANKVLESMSEDEIRALASLPPKNAQLNPDGTPILASNGLPIAANNTSGEVNEHIKSMTRKQMNNMHGIKKDYVSGKASLEQSLLALKGFGLSEEDANIWLGVVTNKPTVLSKIKNFFSVNKPNISQVDKVLMALEACAEDDNDDEVILTEMAHIHNSKDALKYERQIMKFADALVISIEELDNAILNALKGNPTLTIDELATTLKYDSIKISESIARLTQNGFLADTVEGFKPTQKAIDKPTEPIVSREVYTVYKYGINDEKPALKKGGSSRPFCSKMMVLSLTKSWTFEKLDAMENDLGTNVWDYRGGYYNNPDTGIIDPDCRHLWLAITKTRKKK